MTTATPPRRRVPRWRRILYWVVGSLAALVVVAVVGVYIWSQTGYMTAETGPIDTVRANPAISITDDATALVLAPTGEASSTGLVFIPGAKVDPWAYVSKLSGVVADDGITVVITKPWLHLAFFDRRPLSAYTSLVPGVETWMVGGHSLGGVRACELARHADALVLFASYCAADLADSGIPVLSLSGSEDGLSTPEKIADARDKLPADAVMVQIAGASHSSFGDYGLQPGDGTPTISDADMTTRLTDEIGEFAASLTG